MTVFFFSSRRRHTRYIGDWSSDVCSSDLDNFSDDLKSRGLSTPNTLKRYVDVNPSYGGPIKRDSIWFHATVRYNRATNFEIGRASCRERVEIAEGAGASKQNECIAHEQPV